MEPKTQFERQRHRNVQTSVKMKDEGKGESEVLFKNKIVILMGKKIITKLSFQA